MGSYDLLVNLWLIPFDKAFIRDRNQGIARNIHAAVFDANSSATHDQGVINVVISCLGYIISDVDKAKDEKINIPLSVADAICTVPLNQDTFI